ncbi:MAG: tetratricopeptide repeat protein [Bradymonadia bacterium]
MSVAHLPRRSGFALKLEQGLGRLVLSERPVGELLVVEQLELALQALPARLDMSSGVERFRHHRTRLEQVAVYAHEGALSAWVSQQLDGRVFEDVEARAHEGDLVVAGALTGPPTVPFLARLHLEPVYLSGERSLVVSVYECRIFGPASLNPLSLGAALLGAGGLSERLSGPTCAVIDPLDVLLIEICAQLGWKVPERRAVRLTSVDASGGRLRLAAGRPEGRIKGARAVDATAHASAVRYRRFMADYEAKTLYASVEQLAGSGATEAAIEAYERQLEIHPEHPFLVRRLMQLTTGRAESHHRAQRLVRGHLSRYADDLDALAALAGTLGARGEVEEAAESLKRLAAVARERGDVIEAAQALWGAGCLLQQADPQGAIRALKQALELRRRLPGALRVLAELQQRVGDWTSALETREQLLAVETDPDRRRGLLRDLGRLALEGAGDTESAAVYFSRVLDDAPEDLDALVGLARAHERGGRVLAAAQALDRAAQIRQQAGEVEAAAALLVELGRLWSEVDGDEGATAKLRYRQALMLSPGHAGALVGLARICEIAGEPQQARRHYEQALRGANDSALDRPQAHLALGRLLAGPLGAVQAAIPHLQKALDGPSGIAWAAVLALKDIYTEAERWGDLARLLEVAAEKRPEPEDQARTLIELADIIGGRMGDMGRARRLLEKADALSPELPDALWALAKLYRVRAEYGPLAEVLRRLTELVTAPEKLAELYGERGALLKDHLNQVDEAAEAFSLALGCDEGSLLALEGLVDIYTERERFAELAPLLERLGDAAPSTEQAVRHRLAHARLLAGPLMRPNEAFRAYEGVLAVQGDEPEALRGVADLAFESGREDVALEKYLRLYELYEEQGYDEPAGPFKVRLSEVFAALNRAPEALEMLTEAARHDPDLMAIYERALDLFLMLGDLEGVVGFFNAGLKRARRDEIRGFLASRSARLLWRQMRRPEEAAPLLDEVLDIDPNDLEAHRLRLEVATALDDYATVDTLLRAELARAEARERPGVLMQLARLAFGALKRPEEGRRFALKALEIDRRHVPALAALGEHAYRAEDWPEVRKRLTLLAQIEDDEIRPEDAFRLAVAEMHTGAPERARARLASLHHAGDGPPDVVVHLVASAVAVGETNTLAGATFDWLKQGFPPVERHLEVLISAGQALALDPAHKAVAEASLKAALEFDPDREDVAGLLEDLEQGTLSAEEAEPAEVDDELAVLDRLLAGEMEVDPEQEAAFAEEAGALLLAAEQAAGTEDASSCWLALADFRRDGLNDIDGALQAFGKVLELGEGGAVWQEAFEASEELHSIRGDWRALSALYDQAIAQGLGQADDLRVHQASALRSAGETQAALTALEAIEDRGAARPLTLHVELLLAQGRTTEAIDRLEISLPGQPAVERGRRHWQLAELKQPTDARGALAHFAQAADLAPEPALMAAWVELARTLSDPLALKPALEARARSHGTQGAEGIARSNLFKEAADLALAEEALEDARRLYEASLDAWAENVESLEALGGLLERIDDPHALADVLRREHAMSLPGPMRGTTAARLAELFDGPLSWPEQARQWALTAIEDLDGTDDAEAMKALVERLGDAPEPAEVPEAGDAFADEMDFAGLLDDIEEALEGEDTALDPRSLAGELPLTPPAIEEAESATAQGDSGLEDMFAELADELETPGASPAVPTERISGVWVQRPKRGTPPPLARPGAVEPGGIGAEPDDEAPLVESALPELAEAPPVVQRPTIDLEHPDAGAPPVPEASQNTWVQILEDEGLPFEARAEAARALAQQGGEANLEALINRLDLIIERAGPTRAATWRALRGGIRRRYLAMDERVIADLTTAAGYGRFPLAELGLSVLADERGDPAGAAAHARRALEAPDIAGTGLSPVESEEAFSLLEKVFEARDDRAGVVTEAERALSAYPGCRPALRRLVLHYSAQGEWTRLIEMLDEALSRSPTARKEPSLWARKAHVHLHELEQPQEALTAAEEWLALDEADEHARITRRVAARQAEAWPALATILDVDLAARGEGLDEPTVALEMERAELLGGVLSQGGVAVQHLAQLMTRWVDAGLKVPADVRALYGKLSDAEAEEE